MNNIFKLVSIEDLIVSLNAEAEELLTDNEELKHIDFVNNHFRVKIKMAVYEEINKTVKFGRPRVDELIYELEQRINHYKSFICQSLLIDLIGLGKPKSDYFRILKIIENVLKFEYNEFRDNLGYLQVIEKGLDYLSNTYHEDLIDMCESISSMISKIDWTDGRETIVTFPQNTLWILKKTDTIRSKLILNRIASHHDVSFFRQLAKDLLEKSP